MKMIILKTNNFSIKMPLKYLSLFSGIGGFEVAIHNVFPDAICIGYSEVDKFAIKVYQHHFPTHENLGDIIKITKLDIERVIAKHGGCDLVVGGFPCKNLSSLSRFSDNNTGLSGTKSGLFFYMLKICKYVKDINKHAHFIIENNSSMLKKHKEIITHFLHEELDIQYCTTINNKDFGVQIRNRIFWTTFECDTHKKHCIQQWKHVLSPLNECNHIVSIKCVQNRKFIEKKISGTGGLHIDLQKNNKWKFVNIPNSGRTLWNKGYHSDMGSKKSINYNYPIGKSRCISTGLDMNDYLIDRRGCKNDEFIVRHFNVEEKEKLFFLPTNWLSRFGLSRSRCSILLGNCISVEVVVYVLKHLFIENF